jgi:hypothetical protein
MADRSDTTESHWLPCPFCGSADVRKMSMAGADEGGFIVECANRMCGVSTPIVFAIKESPDEKLADIWNRRGGVR